MCGQSSHLSIQHHNIIQPHFTHHQPLLRFLRSIPLYFFVFMNICLNISILRNLMPYILVLHRYRVFTVSCTRITAFNSIVVSCWFVQVRPHSSFPSSFLSSHPDIYPEDMQRINLNLIHMYLHQHSVITRTTVIFTLAGVRIIIFAYLTLLPSNPLKNPKFSLCFYHVLRNEDIWESGGTAPRILNVGTRG